MTIALARLSANFPPSLQFRVAQLAAKYTDNAIVPNVQVQFVEIEGLPPVQLREINQALRHRIGGAHLVVMIEPIIQKSPTDQHLLQRTDTRRHYCHIGVASAWAGSRKLNIPLLNSSRRQVVGITLNDLQFSNKSLGIKGYRHPSMMCISPYNPACRYRFGCLLLRSSKLHNHATARPGSE